MLGEAAREDTAGAGCLKTSGQSRGVPGRLSFGMFVPGTDGPGASALTQWNVAGEARGTGRPRFGSQISPPFSLK